MGGGGLSKLFAQASLSVLSPDVRTLLRDVQYGPSFEKVFLFRLLHVHDADAIEALSIKNLGALLILPG